MPPTLGGNTHVVKDLTVVSTNVYYSNHFNMNISSIFGIFAKCSAPSGTPDVKVELEESWKEPANPNASDGDYVIPDGASAVFSGINDQNAHIKSLSPVPMKYGRFKITGINSNPAGTVLNIRIFMQEL